MRVAIVHDDLVQWGGAERVLEGLCEIYSDAPIFTSVYDSSNIHLKKRFGDKKIITSFLNSIPHWRSIYKAMFPLYGLAFEQFDFSEFNLVISHTTRFAKSIITKPTTFHICYCHTPPRFLWHLSGEKNYGILEPLLSKLRIYDQISSRRVDHFIAGSQNARERIKKIYKRKAEVIHPFIDLKRFENIEAFNGGYAVVVARDTEYKRVDLAEEACRKLGIPLKKISGNLDDEVVVNILAGAKFLIIPGIEDFGLASLEAQALGKTVIAFRLGGALETVVDGKTGIFFDNQSVEGLVSAIKGFNDLNHWNKEEFKKNAEKFSKDNFIKEFKKSVDSLLYL